MTEYFDIWTYLASEPLLWLTATLLAYLGADRVFQWTGRNPLANPVLLAALLLSVVLVISGTEYPTYLEGAQFVHFMLGPATVCLAVPFYQNLSKLRETFVPIMVALFAGGLTAIFTGLALGWALGLSRDTLLSLLPKSTTAPVAMGISESIGGSPTLTVVFVLFAGMTGAIIATPMFTALGFRDWRARGLSAGIASHGIGTARAMSLNETAGAFAGIGMGLSALFTSLVVPIIVSVFF